MPEPCSARLKSVAHRKACPSKGAMHTQKAVRALGSIVCLPACVYCMCAVWRALGPGGDSPTIRQGSYSMFSLHTVPALCATVRAVSLERKICVVMGQRKVLWSP